MRSLASAGGPKVRQDAVRNQTGSIRVVGAEPARGATRRPSQTDMDSGGKINHVEGFDDALGIFHGRGQMAGSKLAGQLCLNLIISKGAGGRTRAGRRNDRNCGVKLASSNRLVAARHRRSHPGDSSGAVFRQQVVISAAGDVGKELVDCARRSNHGVNIRSPENNHYMDVGDDRSSEVKEVRSPWGKRVFQFARAGSSAIRHNVD